MKNLKKYLITFLIGFCGAFLILYYKDVFSQTELVTIYHMLCDAFFVVGVVITCMGLLVFSSNQGGFDALKYGLRSFVGLFAKNYVKKYPSYYDYRAEKAQHKVGFGFILVTGLVFLAIAIVMYFLYRSVA